MKSFAMQRVRENVNVLIGLPVNSGPVNAWKFSRVCQHNAVAHRWVSLFCLQTLVRAQEKRPRRSGALVTAL
jgi:hypothetical protein